MRAWLRTGAEEANEPGKSDQKNVSDHMVELVQILFAFVLGTALNDNRNALLHPLSNLLSLAALFTVFVTTILSWVGWHELMERCPYVLWHRNKKPCIRELLRLVSDVLIVVNYAMLLFLTPVLTKAGTASLDRFIIGYAVLYCLYIAHALLARKQCKQAAHIIPNLVFALFFSGLWGLYQLLRYLHPLGRVSFVTINAFTIFITLVAVIGYRARIGMRV